VQKNRRPGLGLNQNLLGAAWCYLHLVLSPEVLTTLSLVDHQMLDLTVRSPRAECLSILLMMWGGR
jgi:hypothetical protein